MKKCELCGKLARMHCESDQANLCSDCDLKVHGANFLVAKHSRTLLCHVCQNPSPWVASGRNLGSTVTVCDSCVGNGNNECEVTAEESSEGEYGEEEEEGDYEDEAVEEAEEEVEDAENQVVPWSGVSSSSLSMSKPVASLESLSNSEDGGVVGGGGGFGLKRMRQNRSFCSDDEIGCSSSHVVSGGSSNGEASSRKQPRLAEVNQSARNQDDGETKSRSTDIISYLKRLQKHMITNDDDASAAINGISRLSRDQSR